jgi:hypothetical protein
MSLLRFRRSSQIGVKSYSTVNVHRSMLSKALGMIEDMPVGEQVKVVERKKLVTRLLKGCYNIIAWSMTTLYETTGM